METVREKVKRNGQPPKLLKLDIGSGPNVKEGFEGVDQYAFDGKVKHVMDVRKTPWPWATSSVEEIHCSHFAEHLTAVERCAFFNECFRVMKPEGKITLVTPHWASNRAYGDPTHQWPPVSEMFFYYLKKEWRMANAPHTDVSNWPKGYSCNFESSWGYSVNPALVNQRRNDEFNQFALQWYKEAAHDTITTMFCKK